MPEKQLAIFDLKRGRLHRLSTAILPLTIVAMTIALSDNGVAMSNYVCCLELVERTSFKSMTLVLCVAFKNICKSMSLFCGLPFVLQKKKVSRAWRRVLLVVFSQRIAFKSMSLFCLLLFSFKRIAFKSMSSCSACSFLFFQKNHFQGHVVVCFVP